MNRDNFNIINDTKLKAYDLSDVKGISSIASRYIRGSVLLSLGRTINSFKVRIKFLKMINS